MSIGHFFEDLDEFESEQHSPSKATRDLYTSFGEGLSVGMKPHYTFKNGKSIFPQRIDPELFRKASDAFKNSPPIPEIVKQKICIDVHEQFLHYLQANNYMKEFENMAAKYNCEVPKPETNKRVEVSIDDFWWDVTRVTVERSIDRFPGVELTLRGHDGSIMQKDFDPRKLAYMVTGALNRPSKMFMPQIKDVIFNPPATIVFWADGSKTVVKCQNEQFDPEKGLAMAYFKKTHGDKYEYYDEMRKWVGRYEKKMKKEAPGNEAK